MRVYFCPTGFISAHPVILAKILQDRYHDPHFMDEKTESGLLISVPNQSQWLSQDSI